MSKKRLKELFDQINTCQEEIQSIRSKCKHPENMCEYTQHSDTGNWCPSDDSYWTNNQCLKCGHRWMVDGGDYRGTCVSKLSQFLG